MAVELAGRAAVISGAGRGIGRALAQRAVTEGMKVHAWDRDSELLAGFGPDVSTAVVDVCDAEAVRVAAEAVRRHHPDIALLFANAGVLQAGRSWEIAPADWQRLFAVNVGGVANMLAAFVPGLLDQPAASHVVLTGSQSSFVARPGNAAYASSKHAIWCLAEALKLELDEAGSRIGVSLLAPGPVRTSLADGGGAMAPLHEALQRIGLAPDDVAELVFAAIREGRFWIFTHDGFKSELEARVARIVAEQPPA